MTDTTPVRTAPCVWIGTGRAYKSRDWLIRDDGAGFWLVERHPAPGRKLRVRGPFSTPSAAMRAAR